MPPNTLPAILHAERDKPLRLRDRLLRRAVPSLCPFLLEATLKVLYKAYEAWREVPYTVHTSPKLPQVPRVLPEQMYLEGKDFGVEAAYQQAVKADDAQIPTHLWDERIWRQGHHSDGLGTCFSLALAVVPWMPCEMPFFDIGAPWSQSVFWHT